MSQKIFIIKGITEIPQLSFNKYLSSAFAPSQIYKGIVFQNLICKMC